MAINREPLRVLYSFPHKLGANRICYTAWQQVKGLADAGARVIVHPGVVHRGLPDGIRVRETLARGPMRLPYRVLGRLRTLALHDYIVSRRLERMATQVDIVHTWPLAALRTLRTASRLGIPTVLERPNSHTRYAYESVHRESQRLNIVLPPDNEYFYRPDILEHEEEEYRTADYLLCPSEFVAATFRQEGFEDHKLLRHQYGFDGATYYPGNQDRKSPAEGLTMLFAGDCAVRKGLHFALEAWLKSPAHLTGTFRIAGRFLRAYADRLSRLLAHPSVQVLGFRNDVPELMRQSDIFVLPSIEEGSALVTAEARASGCVLLVSSAAGAVCTHMQHGLVHKAGDVETLSRHITLVHEDRALLGRLRTESLRTVSDLTWTSAGRRLLNLYQEVFDRRSPASGPEIALTPALGHKA